MNKGYIVDFVRKTITITAEFEKAMRSPDDDAYKTIQQLCADFPGMRIVRRTHRTPSRYVSKQGVVSKCNPYKNLTYARMEQFLFALPNSTAYLKQYDFLKTYASGIQTNGYSLVRSWFIAQFPLYRKDPLFYLTGEHTVLSATDFLQTQEAMKQSA